MKIVARNGRVHIYTWMECQFIWRTMAGCVDVSQCLQDPTGEAAAEAQKHLSLYELDLGLNHVSRKWSQPVDNGANMLIPVPGGADGPGGVLVCAENFIIYSNQVGLPPHPARAPSSCQAHLPRRRTHAPKQGSAMRRAHAVAAV